MQEHSIVFIKESIPISRMGGGEIWVVQVSKALIERGISAGIAEIARTHGNSKVYESLREYKNIPIINFGYNVVLSPRLLFKRMRARVYYYMPVYAHYVIRLLLFHPQNSYFIVGHHNPWFIEGHNIYDKIAIRFLKRADLNHCLNRFHAEIIKEYVDRDKIVVLPNTFSTLNPNLKIKPNKRSDKFEVLFVGRLIEEKGVIDLLHIWDYLKNLKNAVLKIAGKGPLEKSIKNLSQKYKNVQFMGFVRSEELIEAYKESHVVVLPSRYEASPLVLNEALSFGCAVVAYDIPGIRESIKLRKNPPRNSVTLVPYGDKKAFADAIKKYFELWSLGVWENISKDAIKSVETMDEYINSFLENIVRVL